MASSLKPSVPIYAPQSQVSGAPSHIPFLKQKTDAFEQHDCPTYVSFHPNPHRPSFVRLEARGKWFRNYLFSILSPMPLSVNLEMFFVELKGYEAMIGEEC
jgi:hypothetical protein